MLSKRVTLFCIVLMSDFNSCFVLLVFESYNLRMIGLIIVLKQEGIDN